MKTYTARLERESDGRWTVELEDEPRVHTWGKTVKQARRAREDARNADRVALQQTKKAAQVLTRRGIRMRDAAAILGISHQRYQLLSPETAAVGRKAR